MQVNACSIHKRCMCANETYFADVQDICIYSINVCSTHLLSICALESCLTHMRNLHAFCIMCNTQAACILHFYIIVREHTPDTTSLHHCLQNQLKSGIGHSTACSQPWQTGFIRYMPHPYFSKCSAFPALWDHGQSYVNINHTLLN